MTNRIIKLLKRKIKEYENTEFNKVKENIFSENRIKLFNDKTQKTEILTIEKNIGYGNELELYLNNTTLKILRYPMCCGIGILSISSTINGECLKEVLKEVILENIYNSDYVSAISKIKNFKYKKSLGDSCFSRIEYCGYSPGVFKFLESFKFKQEGEDFDNNRSGNVLKKYTISKDDIMSFFEEKDYKETLELIDKLEKVKKESLKKQKQIYVDKIMESEYYLEFLNYVHNKNINEIVLINVKDFFDYKSIEFYSNNIVYNYSIYSKIFSSENNSE